MGDTKSDRARLDETIGMLLDTREKATHTVWCSLDMEMYKRIKFQAEREERTVNGQIRYMLKRAEEKSG